MLSVLRVNTLYLRNGACLAYVYRVMDARGKLGEHSLWREAFQWHEAKQSDFLASRVLSQPPVKCIHYLFTCTAYPSKPKIYGCPL